ncbi:hypothetical protein [Sandarakinorhabdus sp.]|uniref:hypothetical protein n=1 Tax=Sandarakinorhabdus sp. TaxID=1916663 RepID=UPI00286E7B1D|nr:hypothetical protein [Sandarakinorhabdus sp.]
MIVAFVIALAAMAAQAATPAPPASVLPLGDLPQQPLAKNSCAMFLWERATGRRIAMATAQPSQMLVILGGRATSLPGIDSSEAGAPVLGFAAKRQYRSAAITVALDLAIVPATSGGAIIRDGILTLTQDDGTAIVAPVAGIIGCQ